MLNIQRLRTQRGLSEQGLAQFAGLPVKRIREIERGADTSKEEKSAIAQALGIDAPLLGAKSLKVDQLPKDYRTVGNQYPQVGKQGLHNIYFCLGIQRFAKILDTASRNSPQPLKIKLSISESEIENLEVHKIVPHIKSLIKFDFEEMMGLDPYKYFFLLRSRIEKIGVNVVCQTLRNETFRGYCLADDTAPVIFINIFQQHYRVRIFTLVHELVHLALGKSAIGDIYNFRSKIESFCNKVTIETLTPESEFKKHFRHVGTEHPQQAVSEIASSIPLSKMAIAIRISEVFKDGSFVGRWLSSLDRSLRAKDDYSDSDLLEFNKFESDNETHDDSDSEEDKFIPHHTENSYQVAKLGFGIMSMIDSAITANLVSRFDISHQLNIRPDVIDGAIKSYKNKLSEIASYGKEEA